jgi:cell division protein FtsI/penicillin-binding protein 2
VARISDTITQRRRLGYFSVILVVFGAVLVARLFYLQIVRHDHYVAQASAEHTRKYEVPARRGELFLRDGEGTTPIALNQTLKLVYADPRLVDDKPKTAEKLATVLGGSKEDFIKKLNRGIEYSVLAERVPRETAEKVAKLDLKGIGLVNRDYRTYPEGQLAAQTVGFVNADFVGQYGVEGYLNEQLSGKPGQLAAKTDAHGVPIATADNISKQPEDGKSYVLTIDRNIQAKVEAELKAHIEAVRAKSGSIMVLDPWTGAVKAMANYPTFDPNNYSQVSDYSVFINQAVSSQFEPGSGVKAFTLAAGLDQGKITPDTTYDDPGCNRVDDRTICNAAGDKAGRGKTMTVVLRDSLNTGVMHVLRLLGGDSSKINLVGKKILYDYFTDRHFGFGERTGIEQANEAAGVVKEPSNAAGNNTTYANMTFGQGMSVTMVQMVAAMAAIANGGTWYQPRVVDAVIGLDDEEEKLPAKAVRDGIISKQTANQLSQMLTVVVERGSGYRAKIPGYTNQIAGKTGTAQVPRPDGQGYYADRTIGTFVGFAPVSNPRFVLMVRINEPKINGYAEVTTVPAFRTICDWLFKYYGIPPSS